MQMFLLNIISDLSQSLLFTCFCIFIHSFFPFWPTLKHKCWLRRDAVIQKGNSAKLHFPFWHLWFQTFSTAVIIMSKPSYEHFDEWEHIKYLSSYVPLHQKHQNELFEKNKDLSDQKLKQYLFNYFFWIWHVL